MQIFRSLILVHAFLIPALSANGETWKYSESKNWSVSIHEGQDGLFCSALTIGKAHEYQLGTVMLSLIFDTAGSFSFMIYEEDVQWSAKEYAVGFHVDDDRLGLKLFGNGADGPTVMGPIPNNDNGRQLINRISNGNKLKIYDPENFKTLYTFDLSGSKQAIVDLSRCAERLK